MRKLKPDRILEEDVRKFVEEDSDFGFEMKVLHQLRSLNFECSHAAVYQDPVSDKLRQFDIRARKRIKNCTLKLSVECKNLRENYPLLLSAVPRTPAESFHQLISKLPTNIPLTVTVQTVEPSNIYKPAEMVVKQTDQIGRNQSGLFSDDSATFEKLNQALNSSRDVVQSAARADGPAPFYMVIVPVLVVPAERLWQADYGENGALLVPPRKVERGSLLIDYAWKVSGHLQENLPYRLSHLEIVTLDGLANVLDHWLDKSGFFLGLFA